MGVIATVTGGGSSPGDVGPGNLATGKLEGVTDELVFNFVVNIDFGCYGVLLSGTFGGAAVALHGGIGLGSQNPEVKVTNPLTGLHSNWATLVPGMYFDYILTDTLRVRMFAGTGGVTDIDVTIFAPNTKYYHSAYSGLVT